MCGPRLLRLLRLFLAQDRPLRHRSNYDSYVGAELSWRGGARHGERWP